MSSNQAIVLSQNIPSQRQEQSSLPKVFLIGEHESSYEHLIGNYNAMLLQATGNDMNTAYVFWLTLLSDMEIYSKQINFDLNGLKFWMNVFFNDNGTLQHIVYYPKPNSKHTDFNSVSAFFTSFIKQYHKENGLTIKCSHYGSASFPVSLNR